jgi:enterochelin esterase-like enzyme
MRAGSLPEFFPFPLVHGVDGVHRVSHVHSKGMKPHQLLPLMVVALSLFSRPELYGQAKEYTPQRPTAADAVPKAKIISQVLPDRRVIFRLKAPDAHQVSVLVGFSNPPTVMAPSYPLQKDDQGLWTVTVGPLKPDIYEVQFDVDGLMIADPGSSQPKPQRQVNTSLLEIPGDPPTFLETREVPHGTVHAELYNSKALDATRPLLVYTPPGYADDAKTSYPVLYLYHGYGDTVYSWVTEGRVQQILDNAIADGRAVPMIVVIPDTHALNPDTSPRTEIGHYLNENVQAEDRELFEDIIPFVAGHYRIRNSPKDRALAGLSMGGYQTVYTGFVHSVQFSALGVFSAGFLGEPEPLTQALQTPEKIKDNVSYLYVTTGSKDPVTGPRTNQFVQRLDQLKIPNEFEEYPDQIHSMEVWRPSLNKFVAKLFR